MAVSSQRLSGRPPSPTTDSIFDVIRQLGCLQLDPISVVAPSHRLVLWSRLGPYEVGALERLQWQERRLFEYWAHAASIVLTEDYPLHRRLMLAWRTNHSSIQTKAWSRRLQEWVGDNAALKRHILSAIRRRGPLPAGALDDRSVRPWQSSGWTGWRNVDRMLAYLWISGVLVVGRRQGLTRWWDLAERWLPDWTPGGRPSQAQVVRHAAQRSLRALGVARARDIDRHFIAGRYPGLPEVLSSLQRDGTILPVEIRDGATPWPGGWYIHRDDIPLLDRIEAGDWEPRTTLLSPFDNLIRDRDRTRLLFDFEYSLEIYLPAARRTYGYYVLPILHGDRLIGRIDPAVDRKQRRLMLRAVYTEDRWGAHRAGGEVAEAVRQLAQFIGAETVTTVGPVPSPWASALRKAL